MKRYLLIVLLFVSLLTQAQRYTDLPTYTGPSDSAWTIITIPGPNNSFSTRKAFGRDLAKSIIDSLRGALNGKISSNITINGHPITSNVTVTKSDLGLSNVDNTSDASKPVSSLTQFRLNQKADLQDPVFSHDIFVPNAAADATETDSAWTIDRSNGKAIHRKLSSSSGVPATRTVNGHPLSTNVVVTKSDVGLPLADNTADANKPVSVPQAAALAPLVHNHTANQVTNGIQVTVLPANVTNATTNYADVTGLSFPVTATKIYWFKFMINYASAASTTGSRWSINGPAGGSVIRYRSFWTLDESTTTAPNEGMASYNSPALASVSSIGGNGNYAFIEGVFVAGASGNVIARFASEVSSSGITAAKDFSIVHWQQLN